jgi:trans-aconitate 2-methyltransferase
VSTSWDPGQYLKFRDERTRPSIDLASRVLLASPTAILDVGCGPGNSTEVLHARWPTARITGLDNSPEMIAKARASHDWGEWVCADAASLAGGSGQAAWDLVFSNAVLQWIPDHERLVPSLFGLVAPRGALAIQVPANSGSPLHRSLLRTAGDSRWNRFTSGCASRLVYREPSFYYHQLCGLAERLDVWETTYHHEMTDHRALVEWYKGTGMRPCLERLPDEPSRRAFEDAVLEGCRAEYPVQPNGRVIYPFRRLFFVAYAQPSSSPVS